MTAVTQLSILFLLTSLPVCMARKCPRGYFFAMLKGCLSCSYICNEYSMDECIYRCGPGWVSNTRTTTTAYTKTEETGNSNQVAMLTGNPKSVHNQNENGPHHYVESNDKQLVQQQRREVNQPGEPKRSRKLTAGAIFVIVLISVPTLACAVYVAFGYCCENKKANKVYVSDGQIIVKPNILNNDNNICFRIMGITFSHRPVAAPVDA